MENMGIEYLLDKYRNKKIFITGHTGFKGTWLAIWLEYLGAKVIGYALDPYTNKDNYVLSNVQNLIYKDYRGDIRDKHKINEIFKKEKPEVVFHLAAQPLVLDSFTDPVKTYETNIMGTINILDAIRTSDSNITSIFITSDKCYANKEWVWGYRETDPMGGYDPYSASKGACELIISSYLNSFFPQDKYKDHQKSIASARAGNVIGGGDWATNRIVPDFIKAFEKKEKIQIRNPQAVRPWQHVLEPLGGYLMLGAKMMEDPDTYSGGWNFGPWSNNIVTVKTLVKKLIEFYGSGEWQDISSNEKRHEANLLSLDISKANQILKWCPLLTLDETIQMTTEWYMNYKTKDVYDLGLGQIKNYMEKWKLNKEN